MIPFFEHKPLVVQSRRECENFIFPPHMHISAEFIYINSGELCIDYLGNSYFLAEGDLAIVTPYTIHGYRSITPVTDYSLAIGRRDTYGYFKDYLLQNHPITPVVKKSELPEDIPALMQELVSLNGCEEKSTLVQAIISLILARTLPLLDFKPNTEKYSSTPALRALTYIAEHFREDLSLETVAEALNISRFAVSRLFSSTIKMNFVKYVNFVRIEYAKELLDNTRDSVLTIALDCGYDTVRTFNRVFKEFTGTTPLKYRSR